MTRRALYIVALAVIATSQLAARDAVNVTSCINNDTLSTIKIIEPAALSLRVAREGETLQHQGISDLVAEEDAHSDQSNQLTNRVAGYRVQVFSDNNQRTAKSEARSKETKIKEAFPDLGTYIVYNSPFWRLKVGERSESHS